MLNARTANLITVHEAIAIFDAVTELSKLMKTNPDLELMTNIGTAFVTEIHKLSETCK